MLTSYSNAPSSKLLSSKKEDAYNLLGTPTSFNPKLFYSSS